MKKFAAIFIFAALAGWGASCFAEDIQGSVEAIDTVKNEIMVKDEISGMTKAVMVHPNVLSSLKKGCVVKASLKSGSNLAQTIQVEME